MTPMRAGWLTGRSETLLGWLGAAALVVLVYSVVVRGGGLLIGSTASPHLGLSVLATAIVAFTIEPVRLRVERLAPRFIRSARPSPYDVLTEFSSLLGRPSRDRDLTGQMARLLAEGTGAEWAQVWMLVYDRLALMATHPPDADARADPPPLAAGEDRDRLRSVPVGHGGRLFAVLRVQEAPGRPLSPVEQRLFAGLAAQAGLALRDEQLRAELRARHRDLTLRAAELRLSRDELVAAEDRERQRLERDLHDGAQQQLVALGINLRLAQALAESAPDQATALRAEQADAATTALDTLTTLSRGVQPQLLSEHGLVRALATAVTASPVPTRLAAVEVGRFTAEVEAAVYFCCLEALQNAAKHARATAVEVGLAVQSGMLRLSVSDDGVGLDPDGPTGSGLRNMRERIESLGGHLDIAASPGTGTRVTAVVPTQQVPRQRGG
jgi:signal transduction histidine kinase